MVLDFIFFPFFLCLIFILGAGGVRLSNYKTKSEYPDYFYLIFGFLILGFVSVIVNFYSGIASPVTYGLIATIFPFGIFHITKIGIKPLKTLIIFALFLTPMAATMRVGYDTGLYHLPHQQWIRDEKVIFGLANFHDSLGFSSVMEYINAPLWIGKYFKLLAYSQTGFIASFLLFIRWLLVKSGSNASFGIGGMLAVSFILYSTIVKTDYTSTDIPMGVMFAITFLYGLHLLLKKNAASRQDIAVLFMCGLFTSILKANGVFVSIWMFFVVCSLLRLKLLDIRNVLYAAIVPAILAAIWLIRGLIVSGCFIFPVVQTCLDLPWSAAYNAENAATVITAWARQPATGLAPMQSWNWLYSWWLPAYSGFILGMLAIIAVVAVSYRFLFREKDAHRHSNVIIFAGLTFILSSLAIWFIKAPTPRFGIGTFISLPPVIALSVFGIRQHGRSQLFIHKAANVFMSLLLIEYAILGYVKGTRILSFDMMAVPGVMVRPDANFGVRPSGDNVDQCWLAKYCSPHDRPALIEQNGIRMFPSVKEPDIKS